MCKRLSLLLAAALLFAILPLRADEWDKKTTVTFARPVELPNIVLPAGTYVFKLMNSSSDRNIVLVYNTEGNHLYTTILAIPNYRLNPTGDVVLRFNEGIRGRPDPLRAWFYPGDNYGQEFVYPKKRAAELAETVRVPIFTAPIIANETPEQLIREPVVAVTPQKKEVRVAEVTQGPPAPTLEELTAPPARREAANTEVARGEPLPPLLAVTELPKTASPLPSIVAIGVCFLAIVLVLRSISKRSV
jgi:hypothetical protein